MSLATDLTTGQRKIECAERAVSELIRSLKGRIPNDVYGEIQVQLCVLASEATLLKTNLAALRMVGELEQQPAAVTAKSLELHPRLLASLHRAGDHTLDVEEGELVFTTGPKHDFGKSCYKKEEQAS